MVGNSVSDLLDNKIPFVDEGIALEQAEGQYIARKLISHVIWMHTIVFQLEFVTGRSYQVYRD